VVQLKEKIIEKVKEPINIKIKHKEEKGKHKEEKGKHKEEKGKHIVVDVKIIITLKYKYYLFKNL
jgi:hypothetical protein